MLRRVLTFVLIISSLTVFSQDADRVVIKGQVVDGDTDEPIEFVTVYLKGINQVTETDEKGGFTLFTEPNKITEIVFTRIGYKETQQSLAATPYGQMINVVTRMSARDSDVEIVISDSRIEEAGMIREEVEALKLIPSTSGNFESILPHIALGTSSGTGGELSSQYNVRGGNYDENLVYVNDFEIFRPQLIRNSQQEGLSFPNIDLIRDLSFSSGGFEARYGDKMSSVLDIRYKRPEEFKASAQASFLGASAHIEGSLDLGNRSYEKFRYLIGARYKTNRYLLSSLEVKGEYAPTFTDLQAYFTYDINRDLQVGLIGNYNRSVFNFVPKESAQALGLIDFALQLSTAFEGSEQDRFFNGMTGLSLTYLPERDENPLYLKLLASNYLSDERESFDILGFYRLAQIETSLGSDNFAQEVAILGAGTQHEFGRNRLYNRISNLQHRGGLELQRDTGDKSHTSSNFIQWNLKFQTEEFNDYLNEWERLDSAGYSLPFSESNVFVANALKTENNTVSSRYSSFLQNSFTSRKEDVREFKLTAGVRGSYWSLNEQFLISPRAQLLFKPLNKEKDIAYKVAAGVYYQPPLYRELRRPDGTLNKNLKAQKSVHLLAGLTRDFYWKNLSDAPFKFIGEIYYKKLSNLVSYEIDNVRIRYSGENDAEGYVAGLDLRINGEFVPNAESWVNVSFLQAKERIIGVDHQAQEIGDTISRSVKWVPRPTDQFMTVNLFFQDYLPSNENFKTHVNLLFGSGLPFGVKDNNIIFRNPFKYREYQRLDIGFSWLLWNESWKNKNQKNPFRFANNVWMSLEVFNLLGIENVASNTWIKSIFNTQYAIPNNLTSRRINLRLKVDI